MGTIQQIHRPDPMQPGDEWAYRLRDSAPSERVRIVETTTNRHHVRATIEHLDGESAGHIETVPGTRLRAPWSDVAQYDKKMAAWARLDSEPMTEVETYATEIVIELLVPKPVATSEWAPVRHAMAVHDVENLARLMKVSIDLILADAQSFDDGGTLNLSPLGATLVCAALCRAHPATILEHVLADEASQRELCITGFTGRIIKGKGIYVDTDDAWRSYLDHTQPIHELLRQWCGHRAVDAHQRKSATEGEVHRLDRLLDRAIRALDTAGMENLADELRREHLEERVTPGSIRPLVERPAEPVVHFIPARRGRWWG